jgi:sugar phosphate isomerase/epimerase
MKRYGVDLITFYHPTFWGLSTRDELLGYALAEPAAMWERIMAGCRAAGITFVEMTFAPADWTSALSAYGSPEAFKAALASYGLELKSGFFVDLVRKPEASSAELADGAAEYADFIHRAGGDTVVVAPPMRRSTLADPPLFVGLDTMQAFADHVHAIGYATLGEGVRTAVHTEAHSIVCTTRDIDLLLTITDPTYVSMCPDTGHLFISGSEPSYAMARHRERMIISHWKDATGPMPRDIPIDDGIHVAHREYFRRVGDGRIDWAAWDALSESTPAADTVLMELDAVADPVEQMALAREYLTAHFTA